MEERKTFYKTAEKGKFYMREAPAEEEKNLMRTYYPKTAGMIRQWSRMPATDWIMKEAFYMTNIRINGA